MNKTMLLVRFLQLLLVIFVAGCASAGARKSAIESIFQQRTALGAKYTAKCKTIDELDSNSRQLVAALKGIELKGCPTEFRSVWLDYIVQVEDTNMKRVRLYRRALENGTDLAALAKLGGAALIVSADPIAAAGMLASIEPKRSGERNKALAQAMISTRHQLDEAWRKLERTAMSYDVIPVR